jgi:hypothetical protein
MPGTIPQSEIVQPTGDVHHHVPDIILPVAELVFHDTTAFDTTDRMLDPHFLARNTPVFFFLCGHEFPAARLFRWLLDRHARNRKPLKPHVLIEHTASGQYIVFVINNRFLMPFPCMCWAQKLNGTPVINEQNVFHRMTALLAAVIFCLFIGIYWSLDGTFGAIMVKRGDSLRLAQLRLALSLQDGREAPQAVVMPHARPVVRAGAIYLHLIEPSQRALLALLA